MLLEFADRGSLDKAIETRRFYRKGLAALDLVSFLPNVTLVQTVLKVSLLLQRQRSRSPREYQTMQRRCVDLVLRHSLLDSQATVRAQPDEIV